MIEEVERLTLNETLWRSVRTKFFVSDMSLFQKLGPGRYGMCVVPAVPGAAGGQQAGLRSRLAIVASGIVPCWFPRGSQMIVGIIVIWGVPNRPAASLMRPAP